MSTGPSREARRRSNRVSLAAEPGDQDEVLPAGDNQAVNVIQEKQAKSFTSPLSAIVLLSPRARNSPSWSTGAGDGRQRGSGIDDGSVFWGARWGGYFLLLRHGHFAACPPNCLLGNARHHVTFRRGPDLPQFRNRIPLQPKRLLLTLTLPSALVKMGSTVTPEMRQMGWNVHFLDATGQRFAGVYQHQHPDARDTWALTDAWRELRLCFSFDTPPALPEPEPSFDTAAAASPVPGPPNTWRPCLLPDPPTDAPGPVPAAILIDLDPDASDTVPNRQLLPAPPADGIDSYHVVFHAPARCRDPGPLCSHRPTAPCLWHVPTPSRRHDARYLAPNKPSSDPRVAVYPTRRTAKAVSPRKRSASGSASRSRSLSPNKNDDDQTLDGILIPEPAIALDVARQEISKFRTRCMTGGAVCAVTGLGRSWCASPAIGPAIQAAHIVPQLHYHLYPRGIGPGIPDPNDSTQLRGAWLSTWSITNGILLASHIHQLFDARLVSIHPRTLRIRAFVPYDLITAYHGRVAALDKKSMPDRNALQHHWDMCCIENMAAMSKIVPVLPEAGQPVLSRPIQLQGSIMPPDTGASASLADLRGGDPRKRSSQAMSAFSPTAGSTGLTETQALTPPISEDGDRVIPSVDASNDEEGMVDTDEEHLRGRPRKRRRCTSTLVS